jgi:hypothetical protein
VLLRLGAQRGLRIKGGTYPNFLNRVRLLVQGIILDGHLRIGSDSQTWCTHAARRPLLPKERYSLRDERAAPYNHRHHLQARRFRHGGNSDAGPYYCESSGFKHPGFAPGCRQHTHGRPALQSQISSTFQAPVTLLRDSQEAGCDSQEAG